MNKCQFHKLAKQLDSLGEAAAKHRAKELKLDKCPKCQFEAVGIIGNEKVCGHCGYTYSTLPMGVSQWKEYGKKYDYWKFFEADQRHQLAGERAEILQEAMDAVDKIYPELKHPDTYDEGRQDGISYAIEAIRLLLNPEDLRK